MMYICGGILLTSVINNLYRNHMVTSCIFKTLPHRLCNNNITDVAQEVMLHNYATYFALGKMLSIQQTS